jgi:hypothetical protein
VLVSEAEEPSRYAMGTGRGLDWGGSICLRPRRMDRMGVGCRLDSGRHRLSCDQAGVDARVSGGVDWVIAVRLGEANEELRFSARSVAANVRGVRNLVIAGYRPDWLAGARHIDVPQDAGEKYVNAVRIWRAVANEPTLSDQIVVAHDDLFVMEPTDVADLAPRYHGRLIAHIDRIRAEGTQTVWRQSLERTRAWLRVQGHTRPLSYAVHVPVLVDRRQLAETYARLGDDAVRRNIMTVHAALHGIVGAPIAGDVKVSGALDAKPWRTLPLLSTSDGSFANHPVGDRIRRAFPEPSPWESDQPNWTPPTVSEEMIIMNGYMYRNRNTGDTVTYERRNARLDRLSNWELIGAPKVSLAKTHTQKRIKPATPVMRVWFDYRGREFELPADASLTMYDGAHTHAVHPATDPPVPARTLCGGRACPTRARLFPAPAGRETVTCAGCLRVQEGVPDDWEPATGEHRATEPETFD